MASAKDQRQCWLMLLLFVYKVCLPNSARVVAASGSESRIVEWVSRRLTTDFYHHINGSTPMKCQDNTYLISEDQCVKDQELFRGCGDAIVPTSSLYLTTIAVFDPTSAINITYLSTGAENGDIIYEMFKINETNQLVNSSLCQISSLEVYRGRQKAIEISHQGFSLSENGSIKITTGELGYDLEDYVGELYRMNLSCFGGLPKIGCLFFKVQARQGLSSGNVTNAKFDCTVPGTLIKECSITITSEPTSVVTVMVTTTITSISNMPTNVNVPILLASVISGVAIAVILILTVIMCIVIKFKVGRNGQQNLPSTTESINTIPQKKTPVSANIQDQEGSSEEVPSQKSTYINLDPDHCHPMKNPAYVHIFDS